MSSIRWIAAKSLRSKLPEHAECLGWGTWPQLFDCWTNLGAAVGPKKCIFLLIAGHGPHWATTRFFLSIGRPNWEVSKPLGRCVVAWPPWLTCKSFPGLRIHWPLQNARKSKFLFALFGPNFLVKFIFLYIKSVEYLVQWRKNIEFFWNGAQCVFHSFIGPLREKLSQHQETLIFGHFHWRFFFLLFWCEYFHWMALLFLKAQNLADRCPLKFHWCFSCTPPHRFVAFDQFQMDLLPSFLMAFFRCCLKFVDDDLRRLFQTLSSHW